MTRRRILLGALALLLIAAAWLGGENLNRLDYTSQGRDMWQRPADLIDALDIKPGQQVADLGAGQGYFVPYLASAVGPQGTVHAVDVEADITAALERRFPDAPVRVVLGAYDDPKLPDGAVDLVFIVNTFHHIQDRPAYFARLKQDLAPGGRVALIEPDLELTGVLSWFVNDNHASTLSGVREEMRAAGYREQALLDFLPVQFAVVFAPQ